MTTHSSITAIQPKSPAEFERFLSVPDGIHFEPDTLAESKANEHWLLEDATGARARCSLWWHATPTYQGDRVGLIGHYAAPDTLAEAVLRLACDRLRLAGCALAVGPIDGSTYHRYRLVTESSDEPTFLLEPHNPASWPAHFTGNGFTAMAQYYSAVQDDLDAEDPRVPVIEQLMEAEGVRLRPLVNTEFERELRYIYPVVAAGFAQSLLASPISEDEFVAMYSQLQVLIDPQLVQIAETDERAVGFLLVLPDWRQHQRGEAIDTVIAKTMAVLPEYSQQGLGILLCARAQEAASNLGYSRAIHALMHEDNFSRRLSAHFHGHIIRRYTLYMKPLEGTA